MVTRRIAALLFVAALTLFATGSADGSLYTYSGVVQGGSQVSGSMNVNAPASPGTVNAATSIIDWIMQDLTLSPTLDMNSTQASSSVSGTLTFDSAGDITAWDLAFAVSATGQFFESIFGSPTSGTEFIRRGNEQPIFRSGAADWVQSGQVIPEPASFIVWGLLGIGLVGIRQLTGRLRRRS